MLYLTHISLVVPQLSTSRRSCMHLFMDLMPTQHLTCFDLLDCILWNAVQQVILLYICSGDPCQQCKDYLAEAIGRKPLNPAACRFGDARFTPRHIQYYAPGFVL